MTAFDAWSHPRDRHGRFRRGRREGRIIARRTGAKWMGRYVPNLWPSNRPLDWRVADTKDALMELIAKDIEALHPNRDVIAQVHVLGTWS